MQKLSATTGRNLIGRFMKLKYGETIEYHARANGFDRRGEQRWNRMELVAVHPEKSNAGFTTISARFEGGDRVELRIFHGTRYLTEA